MNCDIHNVEFKGPNSRGNYWHVINFEKGEYCNKPASETTDTPYTPKMAQVAQEIREKIAPEPDWDGIARGKVRHGVAIAFIQFFQGENELLHCDEPTKLLMEEWVNWIMTGE